MIVTREHDLKVHLYRSSRSTWCGKFAAEHNSRRTIAREQITYDSSKATCKTCLKADAAEQRKQDAASA
jgi:hypothetical protein